LDRLNAITKGTPVLVINCSRGQPLISVTLQKGAEQPSGIQALSDVMSEE